MGRDFFVSKWMVVVKDSYHELSINQKGSIRKDFKTIFRNFLFFYVASFFEAAYGACP